MRTPRRGLVAVTFGLLVLLGSAGVAYVAYFSDRALPRTSVAGVSVAGMTPDAITSAVQKRFDDVSVALQTGDDVEPNSLADLGYTLDVEATLAAVFAPKSSWSSYATSLVSSRDVAAVLTADGATLDDLSLALVEQAGHVGSDAVVRRSKNKKSFVVTPAVIGQAVVMEDLRAAVASAGRGLASANVEVQFVDAPPPVTTADAEAVADAANVIVARRVAVFDGGTKHVASKVRKASWITIPDKDGVPGPPKVKAAKVRKWVRALAEDARAAPTNGLRNVSAKGTVLSVVTQARDGRVVSNAKAVSKAAVQALSGEADYVGEFSYRTLAATWTDRTVAVGAQKLAYPATDGEKWIDVNLTRHTMTAYVGATVVKGPVSMVSGAAETPTVVGTFRVYHKNPMMTMRGNNADGTRYETPDVPWSSFFHNGYALHGAPWRSSYGYAASHGCINLPVGVAKWVYDWASVGTTVVSHH